MDENWFDRRVFVVTGGTQGLGAATARALAGAGADGVVICGRNRERGAQVKDEIEAAGAEAEFVAADLARVDDCHAVIAACERRFGRIDGLVNAAGSTERGGIEETTAEPADRMFAVNAWAPFLLMQAAKRLTTVPPIMIISSVISLLVNFRVW